MLKSIKRRIRGFQFYYQFQSKVTKAKQIAKENAGNTEKKANLVFIAGCGRSGTTMLGNLLSLGKEVTYLHEPRDLWIAVNEETDIWGYRLKHIKDADLSLKFDESQKKRFNTLISKVGNNENAKVILEKTPENVFRLQWLSKVVDGAKLIFIVRNGNDVVRSIDKEAKVEIPYGMHEMNNWFGWEGEKKRLVGNTALQLGISKDVVSACDTNSDWAALEWITAIQSMDRYRSSFTERNQILVRYEEVILKPWDSYKRLYGFMGLEADDSLRPKVEGLIKLKEKAGEPVKLPKPLQAIFNETMIKCGY